MQRKNDNLLDKFVKKNYNNELEKVLERKYFDENAKSLLLNILYKIEAAYKDYEKVKTNVESKEEFIQNIIQNIKQNCDEIRLVKLNSEESKILKNHTFLIQKNKKKIICYPIERKLLYCISKISKKDIIVKEEYFLISKTLSDLINVGNSINTIEPMRDFNGYSWATIPQEIESTIHNLAYQNLRILLGYKFLNNWIKNSEFIIDYLELCNNKLEEKYGEKQQQKFMRYLIELSILLELKFEPKIKDKMYKLKEIIEEKLEEVEDNEIFIKEATRKKIRLTKEIKKIDETLNNKNMLQEEYEKRNKKLFLEEKIFSIRILSELMAKERKEKIEKLEEINELLKPKNFVNYKRDLQEKAKKLELLDVEDLEEEIEKITEKLQKVFLECYLEKVNKSETKQDIIQLIYEYRYYQMLPINQEKNIYESKKLSQMLDNIGKEIIKKAQILKVLERLSKDEILDYKLLKNIFQIRIINLEETYIKLIKEKDNFFLQFFDENAFEEKIEIEDIGNLNKKDLNIKLNKKVKIFN